VGNMALACGLLGKRHYLRRPIPNQLPARSSLIPDGLQGAHGVGLRPYGEPAHRGDAHAHESHSQRADHQSSGDRRGPPLDL